MRKNYRGRNWCLRHLCASFDLEVVNCMDSSRFLQYRSWSASHGKTSPSSSCGRSPHPTICQRQFSFRQRFSLLIALFPRLSRVEDFTRENVVKSSIQRLAHNACFYQAFTTQSIHFLSPSLQQYCSCTTASMSRMCEKIGGFLRGVKSNSKRKKPALLGGQYNSL